MSLVSVSEYTRKNLLVAFYVFHSDTVMAQRYTGLGCSNQPDQESFAILHSSKEVPKPLDKENGMVLDPIRMKPEHPSTALPSTSRIHFGRAYGISHEMPLKSLGLIHAGSMQYLISQSEVCLHRKGTGCNNQVSERQTSGDALESTVDQNIIPADMELVKDMRRTIMDVLGQNISVSSHPPPMEPLLGLGSLSLGSTEDITTQAAKRVKPNT